MQLLAHTLTPATRTWLHTAHRVRVLHVFPRACNLLAANGSVLAVVTSEIGDGPFNIVVPPLDFTQHVTPSGAVSAAPDRLRIGSLEIDLTAAAEWNPCLNWATLRHQQDRVVAQIGMLESVLRDHAPANSLAHLVVDLPAPQSALELRILRVAARQWRDFAQGVSTLDRELCVTNAAKIAGLGSGLTPAGDDWLLGCVLAAQIALPSPRAADLIVRAVQDAAARTSPLSAAWLRAAAGGACSYHWHVLLDRCVGNSARDLDRAAQQVVQQGHSSGADALAGFVAVLRLTNA